MGSIPGLGGSLGGGHGNPLQYSSLENPMGRGVWRATVHRVSKGQTGLKLDLVPTYPHTLVQAQRFGNGVRDRRKGRNSDPV